MLKRLLISLTLLLSPLARAGLGPQNLLLVVNSASPNSIALASAYVDARHIPTSNIVFIDLPKQFIESIDVENFRRLILSPILDQIKERKLNAQIDCIAYSADFPHAVKIDADISDQKLGKIFTPVASINGLTYLYAQVLKHDPTYVLLNANRYAPPIHRAAATQRTKPITMVPPRAFRRITGWDFDGTPLPNRPDRGYLLSTVLGITAGRGNTLDELKAMIQRSAAADGSAPNGTIYYMVNSDVRSRARQWGFPLAAKALQQLNVRVQIIQGDLPMNQKDVAGAMVGIADFDWNKSASTITPGAICEHLTSYGGIMYGNAGQTPLSAFIRAGASGASGTVTEPFAIQEKFPSPLIHAYYASGCTLAESFYQSVSAPYQLLIVGDPLCKPWGKVAKLTLNIQPHETLKDTITLKPKNQTPQFPLAQFALLIDGHFHSAINPNQTPTLDTTQFPDGYHELLLVATASDPIASQSHLLIPVNFNNHNQNVTLDLPKTKSPTEKRLTAHLEGAHRLILTHLGRPLATADSDTHTFSLPADLPTPATLQIIATIKTSDQDQQIASEPITILN